MQNMVIWHNPNCSKSRATLALLKERGHDPCVVRYLEDPPDPSEIKRVLDLLGYEPRALIRRKERLYDQLGLAAISENELLIRALAENPRLIERPVVIYGNRAEIGRPPEKVLALLDG